MWEGLPTWTSRGIIYLGSSVPQAAAGSVDDDEVDEDGHANRSWLEIGF